MLPAQAQAMLPKKADFNADDPLHEGIRNLVEKSARDFAHIRGVIGKVHESRLQAQGVKP